MDQIAVNGLVAHRIVAVGGRQSFAGCRAARILLARIVEQIGDIKEGLVAQNVVALADKLVVIVNRQDRVQSLRLQTKQLLHRVDAPDGVQDEGGIQWRLRSPLPLVSEEVEALLLADGTAQRAPELVEAQRVETRSGEQVLGIQVVVAEEFVGRAMHIIGA